MRWRKLIDVSNPPAIDEEDDAESIKDEIRDWFLDNFEDPAANTPYESAEGGYQWIWGGPFDAREEIETSFPEVDQDILDELIEELEQKAVEWAPHEDRLIEEDEDFPDSATKYQELQLALDNVENLLSQITPSSSLIGNNNPPDEIGLPPYSDEDSAELRRAIAALRHPDSLLIQNAKESVEATAVFRSKGQKILDFAARHGDKFVESFASQMGKRVADSLTLAFWVKLGGALIFVAESARALLGLFG